MRSLDLPAWSPPPRQFNGSARTIPAISATSAAAITIRSSIALRFIYSSPLASGARTLPRQVRNAPHLCRRHLKLHLLFFPSLLARPPHAHELWLATAGGGSAEMPIRGAHIEMGIYAHTRGPTQRERRCLQTETQRKRIRRGRALGRNVWPRPASSLPACGRSRSGAYRRCGD